MRPQVRAAPRHHEWELGMTGLLTETVTITRPASRETLEARLAECLRERDFRQKHRHGYPASVSDGWLERDIATLRAALSAAPSLTAAPSGDGVQAAPSGPLPTSADFPALNAAPAIASLPGEGGEADKPWPFTGCSGSLTVTQEDEEDAPGQTQEKA
jgi:hypothetical protein